MKVAIASDHAGFQMKEEVREFVHLMGHEALDLGAHSTEPSDYPDFAKAVGECVAQGQADRGVLVCGSGLGAAIAANKVPGVRAGNCADTYSARQGVEHDDMNVLAFGARVVGIEVAKELVTAFLNARFSGAERHLRRLAKVQALEAQYSKVKG